MSKPRMIYGICLAFVVAPVSASATARVDG